METHINNELIRSFGLDFDPASFGIPDNESLSVKEWILKYSDVLKAKDNIFWIICRNEFMSDKDLRLFAVGCAREVFKLGACRTSFLKKISAFCILNSIEIVHDRVPLKLGSLFGITINFRSI